jgi:hypothetical protein
MQIAKIAKWGPCQNLSDVCTFLGNIGICCIFIQNFSKHANPLVQLMHKGTPFKFSTVQAAMQDNLKKALLNSPALCSIDYTSDSPVILAVDTSPITIGFYLCQADPVNPQKHYFARFRSILLNDCKHCFSQPKLELYGLFCTLDKRLEMVHNWLTFFNQLGDISDRNYDLLTHYTVGFFIDNAGMWQHNNHSAHKCILYQNQHIKVIYAVHDDIRHCGYYATHALVTEQYWWPFLGHDIAWYVCSCHICQTRQTRQIAIPPVVATPTLLFTKMYMDTMHLLHSASYAYIVQGQCSLTNYLEFCMLWKETAQTLGNWIFQDVLCRWGTLVEIVSDNGKPFVAALGYLEKKYHINHICISSYNLHTNSIVECLHFDVCQALFKAADGNQHRWAQAAHSIFWSKHMTPQKCMGCSPYYTATGTHPILPFDIIEANYLLPPPDSLLATTNLIVQQAIALQKRAEDLVQLHNRVYKEHNCATACFEHDHAAIICNFSFKAGDLVFVCNTAIEKALNCKMCPHYTSPLVVVSRNRSSAYILCELNGTLLHSPFAAFCMLPYHVHEHIDIPDIEQHIDITVTRLREMEATYDPDPDNPDPGEHSLQDSGAVQEADAMPTRSMRTEDSQNFSGEEKYPLRTARRVLYHFGLLRIPESFRVRTVFTELS